MPGLVAPRTLYEDWQMRRHRLTSMPAPIGKAAVSSLMRVFDYLLKRYAGSPDAARLARFPLSNEVFFNHHAIVVHHHLEKGQFAGVKTEAESRGRISSILKRMKATDAQSALKTPNDGGLLGARDLAPPNLFPVNSGDREEVLKAARLIKEYISLGVGSIDHALWTSPVLPEATVSWLFSLVEGSSPDLRAVEVLTRCENRSALDYIVIAWKKHCTCEPCSEATRTMERIFAVPARREHALERIRAEIANRSQNVRIRAAELLRDLGTVDDVGLLMDLLCLPRLQNDERDAYAAAIQKLSGVVVE